MELRISTWNCFGMGQGLSAVTHLRAPFGSRFRCEEVIRGCADTDVFCVQELLSREAQRFFDALSASHFTAHVRDDNRVRLDLSMRGSGLGIGARASLDKTVLRMFPGERVGWDRLARKGGLYVQLGVGEGKLPVDLLTVHLQAGYDARAAHVRAAQLAHVAALVEELGSPDRAFVLCGDFNIDGHAGAREGEPYRALRRALDGFEDLGAETDLTTFHPKPDGNGLAHAFEPDGEDQRIDYIFFRPARRDGGLVPQRLCRFLDAPLATTRFGDRPGWASDHYGLTATFSVG